MEGHVAKNNESTFPTFGDLDDFLNKHNSNFVWLLVGEFEAMFYCRNWIQIRSVDFCPCETSSTWYHTNVWLLSSFRIFWKMCHRFFWSKLFCKSFTRLLKCFKPTCFQASENMQTVLHSLCNQRLRFVSSPFSHYSVLWMDHLFNLLQLPQHRPHPHPHHQQALQRWLHSHRWVHQSLCHWVRSGEEEPRQSSLSAE